MATKTSSSMPAAQLRKIKKPMIERRRRERINECLNQLKTLVLEATHKDGSRYSKMEKADILEMTVSHLRTLHRRPLQCQSNESTLSMEAADKYMDGFKQCAVEVERYFAVAEAASRSTSSKMSAADSTTAPPPLMIGSRLMRHLTSLLLLHRPPGVQRDAQHLQTSLDQAVESFVKSVAVDDVESDSGASSFSTETSPDRRRLFDYSDEADKVERFPVSFRNQINVVGQSPRMDNFKRETFGEEETLLDHAILHSAERSNSPTTVWTTPTSSSANIIVPLYTSAPALSSVPLVWSYPVTSSVDDDDDESSIGSVIAEFRAVGPSVHPGSPRQADEVPIHRQLTLIANSCNSQQQQQQQLQSFLPPPRSDVPVCSSVAAEKNVEGAVTCSTDGMSSCVPVCGDLSSCDDIVWRPW